MQQQPRSMEPEQATALFSSQQKKEKLEKQDLRFNTYIGQSSPLQVIPVLNTQEWFNVRLEALVNANPTNVAGQRNTVLSNLGLPANSSQGKVDSLPTYDWQDLAFTNGTIFNTEMSMQGGNQNLTYYVSGSYSKQSTIVKPTDFQRGAFLQRSVTRSITN
jgi:hypothetical protein